MRTGHEERVAELKAGHERDIAINIHDAKTTIVIMAKTVIEQLEEAERSLQAHRGEAGLPGPMGGKPFK